MIPARVRRAVDWWRDMPGVEKYRLYTRLVLQSVMVAVVAMLLISGSRTWPTIGIIIAGLASIAGIEAQPDLAIRATGRQRRLAWRFAVAGVAGVWLVTVVGSRVIGAVDEREAAVTASMTLLMASAGVIPFVRHRWPVLIAGAILTPLLTRGPDGWQLGLVLLLVGIGLMWTSRSTVWGLQVLNELENGKRLAAELEVAEERLRFSRDLHDVVGRAFSAMSVKSELAATLARAGAVERAAGEMDEVKALAVSSMEDARTLVRGYRAIDLATEVAGARSLLSAAGCELRVIGEPDDVPQAFHEAAAWVVREGTTNIVKHSTAAQAVLTLRPSGLVLRNDGAGTATGGDGAPSGIDGLRGRLRAVGAGLDAAHDGDEFTLTATWEAV
ncbi:sensor histidine kinase [Tsukamurella ocularis]|uniref:sensor histidine kinase n=1 Tax=Tsukamurella ocularis TaxID=1970234 RepID=UPI0021698420|nr:histidine kinase [Tsukamurella ocularis]MCS3778590.1 two-component system sensor histidine kinase DesK [Tsukamurella ocularis]MCS3789291.1 two-component system sensor histidine kinase DesK [Tsukamurella ocularis]MCS3853141.1 two-component system sensor histidine kinase DesK [Tsukamurella ocularis]